VAHSPIVDGQRNGKADQCVAAVCDDQWDRISSCLRARPGTVEVTATDKRWFIEAVRLYRHRAGIPRRDLPERYEAVGSTSCLV